MWVWTLYTGGKLAQLLPVKIEHIWLLKLRYFYYYFYFHEYLQKSGASLWLQHCWRCIVCAGRFGPGPLSWSKNCFNLVIFKPPLQEQFQFRRKLQLPLGGWRKRPAWDWRTHWGTFQIFPWVTKTKAFLSCSLWLWTESLRSAPKWGRFLCAVLPGLQTEATQPFSEEHLQHHQLQSTIGFYMGRDRVAKMSRIA